MPFLPPYLKYRSYAEEVTRSIDKEVLKGSARVYTPASDGSGVKELSRVRGPSVTTFRVQALMHGAASALLVSG